MGKKRDLKQFQFLWAMYKVFNTNAHTDTSTSILPSPKAHTDPTTATKISIMGLLRIFIFGTSKISILLLYWDPYWNYRHLVTSRGI